SQEGTKLIGSGAEGNANQGHSVSLSGDGNTAIVGGYNDNGGVGAVWIFTRSGGTWSQSGTKLIGSGVEGVNAFQGQSVAISADGNTILIGGNGDKVFLGATWVFVRSGGTWIQQGTKLFGNDVAGGEPQQGWSVGLSADGNTAIVGGLYDVNRGAAWIFKRTGSSWVQQGNKLIGTGDIDGANQGSSVALSADGNTAIIGGYQDNSGVGSIWVFSRNGELWTQQGTKLVGSAAVGNANQGQSVAISANGTTAISGGDGDNGTRGAAWVFTYVPPPTITQFSPTVAATGALIAITGTNLLETSYITLGGTSVASFTVVSSTSILAVVGNGSSGAMSLVTPGGATSLAGFSYIPPPTITQFSPTVAAAGALIAITGTHLLETSSITLGGTSVTAFSIVSSTSILAVVGNGSSGAMSLVTPGGTTSLAGFIFIPPPIISSISPTAVGAGGLITITGSNLNGTFAITLGGTPVLAFTEVSSGTIVAAVGAGSTGAISLTTPGGNTSAVGFVFVPPPFISSFSSTVGPIGTLVTINGSNLNHLLSVVIAGVGAIPISNDGNTLVAMVMPGATEGGVSVVTVGGAASGTGNFSVTSSQPPNAQQGTKLVGSGAIGKAQQGTGVAISADGNTAIIGGFLDNSNRGAAWIFTRTGSTWSQQGNKLVGTGIEGTSVQGFSVDISADGNTVIIGGYGDKFGVGAVWIFKRTGSTWNQQGNKLVGSDRVGPSYQGYSVALSADGNTAIVGGFLDNNNTGAAWIFSRNGDTWTQQGTKLVANDASGLARQGWSVSLSADGNTAIIGGYRDNGFKGAAWIFNRNGSVWTQQGNKLVGTDVIGNAQMGYSVALSADGNTAIMGGPADNNDKGATWIFTRAGGIWSQQGNKLVSQDAVGNAYQGNAVSISADGNTAIIAGYREDDFKGASFVFNRSGNSWSQKYNKLAGNGSVGNANLGWSIDLSSDGNTAIVGGWTDNSDVGASWMFTYVPPPNITSFSPSSVGTGAVVTITGTHLMGTTAITLGGTSVASFTIVSSTTILAVVGNGSSGALSLVTPGGTATLDGFIYVPPPTIISFTPTSAASGSQITITGTALSSTLLITLGGTPVTNFTVISDNSIVASVGNGASGDVSLTTLGGTAALSGFIFIPPPIIASFSPTAAAKGAEINILGTHLDGTFSITLGDTPVSSFTVVSSTSIIATVSTGSSGDVRLTTPGGTTSLNGFVFIPPPIISGFSPSSLGAGQAMTISGNFLTDTYAITLGDTPVNSFTVVSSTTIVAIVGNGSSGAVSLTTPGGSANRDGFNFIPAPNITLFYPTAAGIGTLITITGSNLNGTSLISLGGVSVNGFSVVSSNTIVAMVGNGSSGEMSLITPGGTATRNGFTFIPPPVITSFAPNTAAYGEIITITGNNLNGTTNLSLGSSPVLSFTVVSSTSIIASVSAGSTGAVSLTTPGGTTALNGFVFIPPPVITSFLPNTAASGAIITITGN
ncbi:MAG: beta strand repeat-containing protein, partial [Sediminibacterium sp.]